MKEINFKIALINYDCNPHHKSLDFENFEDSPAPYWESFADSSFCEKMQRCEQFLKISHFQSQFLCWCCQWKWRWSRENCLHLEAVQQDYHLKVLGKYSWSDFRGFLTILICLFVCYWKNTLSNNSKVVFGSFGKF